MVDIRQTALPGVGLRHDFETADGKLVGVVVYRSGRYELFVGEASDPDTPTEVIDLSDEERRALVEVLGGTRIAEELAKIQQRVEGLAIDWIPLPASSTYASATIGDTEARSRTGVSIVAVLREGTAAPAPGPDHRLRAGDVLVVVGTAEGIRRLTELLAA